MDINKTTQTGIAATNPTFTTLNQTTPMTVFTLKVRESWFNKSGQLQYRDNLIKVETLGKNAHWVQTNVKAGKRYVIDGYLRHDNINGVEELKVRSFSINFDHSDDYEQGRKIGHLEGLLQAFKVIKESDTLESAKSKLEVLANAAS